MSSKKIIQPDIMNYIGGAKEITDHRKFFEEEIYWSNSMFSGMPTYQSGAKYPSDILKYIDCFLRFLPHPANYVFLFFSGFFFIGIVWIKRWNYAFLGATMFGLSSYFFIILEIGHNSKAHAIAYFSPLFTGLYLLFKRNKFWGFIITTLFFGLELMANHIQMTYYFSFTIGFFILAQLYISIQNKQIKSFGISFLGFIIAVILALGMNASRLLSTYEYGKESTRGKSDLVDKNKYKPNEGLEKEYITTWSYGKLETLNLFIPNFMGGSSSGKGFEATELKKVVRNHFNSEQQERIIFQLSHPYWGEQPGTSPAYQGAVVCFLAFLGLFFIPRKYLLWILPSLIISILLAWGKNFMTLTNIFIDYFPLYNKFRAVSSFMVISEFLTPLLAMIGLYYYFNYFDNSKRKKTLYLTGSFILGMLIIFYIFCRSLFEFANSYELESQIPKILMNALKQDRITIFQSDVIRTFLLCGITFILLILELHKKISSKIVIYAFIILSILDLWSVNKRFLNNDNFVSSSYVKNLFPTEINEKMIDDVESNPNLKNIVYLIGMNKVLDEIKKQDTTTYRVFNTCLDPFNETHTSYFHQSIGGYHGAKLKKYQEIIERFFDPQKGKINVEILNMLNTKYIFMGNPAEPEITFNNDANGNAWFVSKVQFAKNANQELDLLENINTKEKAVIREELKSKLIHKSGNYIKDSIAYIKLKKYHPNHLIYHSQSKTKQFGIFSEIFYPYGWNVYLDGKSRDYFRVNYVLRGLEIPKGNHKIEFKFEPKIIKVGQVVTLISFGVFVLLCILFILLCDLKKNRIIEKI